MAKSILKVENLETFFYTKEGIVKAVDDISFDLKEGETLGIAGESGAGKSVTALSLIRLVSWPPGKIIGGEILFEGENLLKLSNRKIRNIRGSAISMIFQDPMTSLNPVFTVGRQIMEKIFIHQRMSKKNARKITLNLLRDVGIPNPEVRIDQYPHEYSGGMRQRAMIAMALSSTPKILIADEPTTALDVTIQAQILDLMNKLKDKYGSSIIIITHDMGVLAEMADKIVVMYAGKIMEYADAETIFYNPKHPYTWGLLKSIPKVDQDRDEILTPIRGNPPSLLNLPDGCSFNNRCEYAKNICFKEKPVLRKIGDNHKVACHLSIKEIEEIRSKKNSNVIK
jgi:oligopeptide/dipeptide ABC transporter ATP-binding protein